nr:hypothetical protein [uncultured Chitinophaga sp.]
MNRSSQHLLPQCKPEVCRYTGCGDRPFGKQLVLYELRVFLVQPGWPVLFLCGLLLSTWLLTTRCNWCLQGSYAAS